MTVRTRVAPSPTGDPHVGTAYMALFNWMYAKHHGGQFIFRIEDTDLTRSHPASERALFESLRWLGIEWDEGADVGGDYGPYRQSERLDIYKTHVDQLVEKGHAFHCFCSAERLAEVRAEQQANKQTTGYDGHCLHLSPEEVQQRLDAGESHVVRMKIPESGTSVFEDGLRGTIEIDYQQLDMQVIQKADGFPTYHLAVVVDDHLMKITHVIRGEEWISSTPKHVLLYEYFGWDKPQFIHMPLLRNPDKSKLSKRKNPTSIFFYQQMGFLPEAVINFLARMGWSMPDEREVFTLADMQENFTFDRVSLGGSVFDIEKLKWLNGGWMREHLTPDQLIQRAVAWKFNQDYLNPLLGDIQKRIDTLSDLEPLTGFLFQGDDLNLSAESFDSLKLDNETIKKVLQFSLWRLEQERDWTLEAIQAVMKDYAQRFDLKMKDFMAPFFVALSGSVTSLPAMQVMAVIGADMTRARLRRAVSALGGYSKKQLKSVQKEFDAFERD